MNIRVDLETPIKDGTEVVFRSPVDCSQITGLIVYYWDNGSTASKEFALADAHGNNVGDIDHLFAENVVVKVILDLTTNMAFVQNADTNAYLEGRFSELERAIGTGGGGGGTGANGKSAYELALEHGFEGTEEEWLASLKGEDGADGKDYVLTDGDKEEIAQKAIANLPVYDGSYTELFDSPLPTEIATDVEMTAILENDETEVGSVYKYTGESGTYENGALYVVEERE